jgi:hypothetical protein
MNSSRDGVSVSGIYRTKAPLSGGAPSPNSNVAGPSAGDSGLLNTSLQSLMTNVVDVNGRLTKQKLHNRIFAAYEQKNLTLLLRPRDKAAGQTTASAFSDIPIDSWDSFAKSYHPDNVYELVPRKTRSTHAFMVVTALVNTPHSPFAMEHREDPHDYKLIFREPEQPAAKKWNATQGEKYKSTLGHGVIYDGILNARDAAAVILCGQDWNDKLLLQGACWICYMQEWVNSSNAARYNELQSRWRSLLRKKNGLHIVVSADRGTPNIALQGLAAQHNILLYARRQGSDGFEYCGVKQPQAQQQPTTPTQPPSPT